MARRKHRKHRRRRKHGPSGAPHGEPDEFHPLGLDARDFDENLAYIVGFTSGGAPYGVSWEEATYLKDCPEIVAWLGEEECEMLWGEEAVRAREAQRARLDLADDPDQSMPF